MKETMKRIAAALLAAVLLVTTVPSQVTASEEQTGTPASASSGVTPPENSGVRLVENAKADLTVSLPTDVKVTSDYSVSAYQVLRMVVPVDATFSQTTGEGDSAVTETTAEPYGIENDGTELYYVTDAFKDFFKNAKNSYETAYGTDVVESDTTLYLTYDSAKYLCLSKEAPAVGEDYIEITVATGTKLDAAYFEADIVSRIAPKTASEGADASNASNARLFSDWLSRYVKTKGTAVSPYLTAKVNEGSKSAALNNLVYGYYLVMASDGEITDGGDYICQSILNIPTTGSVQLKISPITIEKTVSNSIDDNKTTEKELHSDADKIATSNTELTRPVNQHAITANIGDRLQYTVVSQIPDLGSYDLSETSYTMSLMDEIQNEQGIKDMGSFRYVFYDTMINQDLEQSATTITFSSIDMTAGDANETAPVLYLFLNNDNSGKVNRYYYFFYGEDRKAVEKYCSEQTTPIKLQNSTSSSNNPDITVTPEQLEEINKYAFARLSDFSYVKNSDTYEDHFYINFNLRKLKEYGFDKNAVTISYKTRLMNDAGNADSKNTAKITYSNDPYTVSSYETITDTNSVYTYDLKLQKAFSDGSKNYAGVYFRLYSASGYDRDATAGAIKFIKPEQQENTEYYDKTSDKDGKYTRADNEDEKIMDKTENGVTSARCTTDLYVSETDGTLELHGLGEGTYYLEEYYAEGTRFEDEGFRVVNTVKIVITATETGEGGVTSVLDSEGLKITKSTTTGEDENANTTWTIPSTVTLDETPVVVTDYQNGYGIQFALLNQKGFTLPLTGELGNWMFAVIGVLLLAAGIAVIVAVNRKKRTEA